MSVNKHRPHVFVLPEDYANLQLANGFHLQVVPSRERQMQVLPVAGGWKEVLNLFNSEHAVEMGHYPERFMVLLIDFDGRNDRLETARASIPPHLADRVFVLGALTQPEDFKKAGLGTYEAIGSTMAKNCHEESTTIWDHDLLRHNTEELGRLMIRVRPILFSNN